MANGTLFFLMASCWTIGPCKINDLKVKFNPSVFRKQALEIFLCLSDCFSLAKAPSMSATVDVGVDGKGGLIKRLGHDNGGCFVPHAGQLFQLLKSLWDFSFMMLDEVVR